MGLLIMMEQKIVDNEFLDRARGFSAAYGL